MDLYADNESRCTIHSINFDESALRILPPKEDIAIFPSLVSKRLWIPSFLWCLMSKGWWTGFYKIWKISKMFWLSMNPDLSCSTHLNGRHGKTRSIWSSMKRYYGRIGKILDLGLCISVLFSLHYRICHGNILMYAAVSKKVYRLIIQQARKSLGGVSHRVHQN